MFTSDPTNKAQTRYDRKIPQAQGQFTFVELISCQNKGGQHHSGAREDGICGVGKSDG